MKPRLKSKNYARQLEERNKSLKKRQEDRGSYTKRAWPISLVFIALLFIVKGILSVFSLEYLLGEEYHNFNLGIAVAYIITGIGLLFLMPTARHLALMLGLIEIVIATAFLYWTLSYNTLLFTPDVPQVTNAISLIAAIFLFSIAFFIVYLLTRSNIKACFGLHPWD